MSKDPLWWIFTISPPYHCEPFLHFPLTRWPTWKVCPDSRVKLCKHGEGVNGDVAALCKMAAPRETTQRMDELPAEFQQRVAALRKEEEKELEKALLLAGGISEENFGNIQKVSWSRTARTDKGVHAIAQSANFFTWICGFDPTLPLRAPLVRGACTQACPRV